MTDTSREVTLPPFDLSIRCAAHFTEAEQCIYTQGHADDHGAHSIHGNLVTWPNEGVVQQSPLPPDADPVVFALAAMTGCAREAERERDELRARGDALHAVVSENLHRMKLAAEKTSPTRTKVAHGVWMALDAAHREYLGGDHGE